MRKSSCSVCKSFVRLGPTRREKCLALPPVCHKKVGAYRIVSSPGTQQANLPIFSPHCLLMLSAKQGSCQYYFFKFFGMTRQGETNPRSIDYKVNAITTTQTHPFTTAYSLQGEKPLADIGQCRQRKSAKTDSRD